MPHCPAPRSPEGATPEPTLEGKSRLVTSLLKIPCLMTTTMAARFPLLESTNHPKTTPSVFLPGELFQHADWGRVSEARGRKITVSLRLA